MNHLRAALSLLQIWWMACTVLSIGECRFPTRVLGQSCCFVLSLSFCFESVSFYFGSVLLYRVSPVVQESGDSGGVLPRASPFCFVFVFSFCFESVSAREPVVPTDLNETAVIFALLCSLLPCASCDGI